MSIKEDLLRTFGATEQHYNAGDYIFREAEFSQHYYQIVTGEVKLNNYDNEGKELIQNIIKSKDSFGTFMLFINKSYPINAVANTDCMILQLSKNNFLHLLEQQPTLLMDICTGISERLYHKFVLMRTISCHNASERLKEVMDMMKQEQENENPFSFEIPFTRQQLASLTGLSLETTIRTVKKMEREKILRIKNRKILI